MPLASSRARRDVAPSPLGRIVRVAAPLLCALPLAAQSPLWIQQSGTASYDSAAGVAPDGAGGVYAVGETRRSLQGWSTIDAWLARYDAGGALLWSRELGTTAADWAAAAAPDGAGGVIVAGATEGDLGGPNQGSADTWVARYDAAGSLLWLRQIGSGDLDSPHAAAPAPGGGVYVGGRNFGGSPGGNEDGWLARLDGSGDLLWTIQFGTWNGDSLRALAADGAGGAYACGGTNADLGGPSAGGTDVWLARVDGSGATLWTVQFGGADSDLPLAAAPDGAGGVFLGGSTDSALSGPNAGLSDAWLARYDAAGSQLWLRQLGTTWGDAVKGLAPDGAGGVHVVGATGGALGAASAGGVDAWLARYDAQGNALGLEQIGTSGTDRANSACPDGAGGLLVGGETSGALGGANAGSMDAWVARFEPPCGASSSYCVASATSLPGCQASIQGLGLPSVGNPGGFTIASGSIPGGNPGLCYFGDAGSASSPLGTLGGQLCVAPPLHRTAATGSGGTAGACDGQLVFTLQDLIAASPIVVPGATLHAAIWARDPANPDGFLLSDGLAFAACP